MPNTMRRIEDEDGYGCGCGCGWISLAKLVHAHRQQLFIESGVVASSAVFSYHVMIVLKRPLRAAAAVMHAHAVTIINYCALHSMSVSAMHRLCTARFRSSHIPLQCWRRETGVPAAQRTASTQSKAAISILFNQAGSVKTFNHGTLFSLVASSIEY
jgi:ribulose-5-phosphate 4-epimerase/fuculose-1-phosphate aldolase